MSQIKHNPKMRSGAAILLVLVTIAIGMLIYFIDLGGIFSFTAKPGRIAPAAKPWLTEDLILPPEMIIEMPEPPKPEINEKLTITAAVTRDSKDRGTVEITFDIDGRVTGAWASDYTHEEQAYSYDATFAGNIDVDRMCTKDGKDDKSQLYFFTKGKYTQKSTQTVTNAESTEDGTIYVTGQMAPNHSAKGQITITTDRKWSIVYDWSTK